MALKWRLKNGIKLHPWQQVTYDQAVKAPRFCDWSQAGTGKTLPALLSVVEKMGHHATLQKGQNKWLKSKRNACVVTPPSAMIGWESTWDIVDPTFKVHWVTYHGPKPKRQKLRRQIDEYLRAGDQVIIMVSWGFLSHSKCIPEWHWILEKVKPHYILLDEVQYMNEGTSSRSLQITSYNDNPTVRSDYIQFYQISATPQTNSPHKGWELFRLQHEDLITGKNKFYPQGHLQFLKHHFPNHFYDMRGSLRVRSFDNKEYYQRVFSSGSILHTRETVFSDRKEPSFNNFVYDLNDEHYQIYATFLICLEKEFKRRGVATLNNRFAKLMRERQLATDPTILDFPDVSDKMDYLKQILTDYDIKPGGDKALILCEFRHTYDRLMAELPFKTVGIQGGMSQSARKMAIDKFNSDSNITVFIGVRPAMSEGVNLQKANVVVNYDLTWALDKWIQGNGRIDRLGQKKMMHYVNMVARDTVDQKMLKNLLSKFDKQIYIEQSVRARTQKKLKDVELLKRIEALAQEEAQEIIEGDLSE